MTNQTAVFVTTMILCMHITFELLCRPPLVQQSLYVFVSYQANCYIPGLYVENKVNRSADLTYV